MPPPKKFPKTLSAPVDEDLWKWFTDRAEAASRTVGAELRVLIQAQRDREMQRFTADHFAGAVVDQLDKSWAEPLDVPVEPNGRPVVPIPLTDDPEEGVA